MQLKELEIRGFKSFPDKTIISFKDGITGIVGPNGSGKSNISDAIRWVLGEQSVKSLRGSKMEDIIFTGTSSRKPLGYAEVSIIFDNASGKIPLEYEEVAFTRRVFRSGESEYYINKNACRLRDIRELLMDTGIGKEGYSIIGQGKIDEILSSRTEDRRYIFEEAAGIVKYKSRKEESERKLKRTEENLTRVQDLVRELSRNERKLKSQAEKAQKYEECYEELRKIELEIYSYNISTNENRIKNISKEIEEKLELYNLQREKIKNKKNNIDRYQEEIEKLEKDLRLKESLKYDINSKYESKKGNKTLIKERISFIKTDVKRLKNTENETLFNLKEIEQEIEVEDKNLKEIEQEIEILKKDLDLEIHKLNSEREKISKEEELYEDKKDKLIELYNTISKKRTDYNNKKNFLENIEARLIELNRLNDKNIKDRNNIELKIEEISNDREKTLREIERNKSKKTTEKEKLSILEKDYNETIKNINDVRISLEKTLSNYKLYLNMEKNYEGYYKGVRNLLRASDRDTTLKNNLYGIVADLMSVDPKYEIAITSALGGRAQNIVVPNQKAGKLLIETSRRNNYGRITCLPVDTIRGNKLKFTESEREKYGIIGVASELIDYDLKYEDIYESLLGRTVVVTNMDSGIKLSNSYSNKLRIVTLDGDIINPGGSMTGGSVDNSSNNIISRKNKIEELEKKSDKYKKEGIELSNKKDKLKNKIESISKGIEKILEEEKLLEINLAENNNLLNNIKVEYERILSTLKSIEEEKIDIGRNVESNNIEIESLFKDIKNLEEEINITRDFIKKGERKLKGIKKGTEDLEEKTTSKKIEFNSIKDSYYNRKKEKERKLVEFKRNKEKIEDLKIEIERKKIEEKDLYEEIGRIEEEIENYYRETQEIEKDLLKLELELKEKKKILEKEKKDLREKEDRSENIDKTLNNLNLEKTKYQVKKETTLENLFKNYSIKYEDLDIQLNKEFNIKKSEDKANLLKNTINGLGNVNLNAISEYKDLKERLDFILQQKEDLNNAAKDLLKVIKDMEEKMKEMFIKSFNEINENFKIIFKTLFNGGEARLTLENKEDILNTGIGIEAKPPGKKLQNLESLSGGEKSLVAVSLLFAILKMKPSPFCVLDEIDAALDEANIGRYTAYLREMSEETQFIIITHRKKTMEIVDTLYGITMEEEGVSKLVSVELTEFEKEVV